MECLLEELHFCCTIQHHASIKAARHELYLCGDIDQRIYHRGYYMSNHNNKNNLYPSGGRLNKKDGLTRYGNSHVKDKTS